MAKLERELRRETPVYINSFNQPTYLKNMVELLTRNSFCNIKICENSSSSPKLHIYLNELRLNESIEIIDMGGNIGPLQSVSWIKRSFNKAFIFSDPDLELPDPLPDNFLSELFHISNKYSCAKVGLALEIPPSNVCRDLKMRHHILGDYDVLEWERQFWDIQLEPGVFRAEVDTTFFLWNPGIRFDIRRCYVQLRETLRPRRLIKYFPRPRYTDIRVAKYGFVARHLPWYLDDGFPRDERELYIHEASKWSSWLRNA